MDCCLDYDNISESEYMWTELEMGLSGEKDQYVMRSLFVQEKICLGVEILYVKVYQTINFWVHFIYIKSIRTLDEIHIWCLSYFRHVSDKESW